MVTVAIAAYGSGFTKYHVVPPSALQAMSLETLGDFAQGGNVLGDIALATRLRHAA